MNHLQATMYVEIDAQEAVGPPGNLGYAIMGISRWNSPDFEASFKNIARWAFELGSYTEVLREVGLDRAGIPIAFAPVGRNMGIWVDMPLGKGTVDECTLISKEAFDEYWQAAMDQCGSKVTEVKSWRVTAEELPGLWSTGSFGSHSDEAVAFFPDGTGFAEASNVSLMFYDSFKWLCPEPGHLILQGQRHFERDLERVVHESASRLQINRRDVMCIERFGGTGNPISVLHLDLGVGDYHWVHGPFARVCRPIEEIEWPAFHNRLPREDRGSA